MGVRIFQVVYFVVKPLIQFCVFTINSAGGV
jgi:hypothetical protein